MVRIDLLMASGFGELGMRRDHLRTLPGKIIEAAGMSLAAIALAVLFLLAVGMSAGQARDRTGRYSNVDPAIKAWVKGLTDQNGNGCCDTADGYPAEVQWDSDTGRYRVRIARPEGVDVKLNAGPDGWTEVPDEALITKPNRLGYAVVWWYPKIELDGSWTPQVRCFLPGAGG